VVLPVPDDLAKIADRIRRRYDPNFALIGPHVTVLPPREVRLSRREILAEVHRIARQTPAFTVSLGAIRTFLPVMPVVFASIRGGAFSLQRLHRRLSGSPLRGAESFPYVPHLTLGQRLDASRHRRALDRSRTLLARRRKGWRVDRLIVVERLTETLWAPLSPVLLPPPPARRRADPEPPGSRRRSGL